MYCPSNIQFSKIRLPRISPFPDFAKTSKVTFHGKSHEISHLRLLRLVMVGLDRLELSTSPLSGVRSSHLSYRPMLALLIPGSNDHEPLQQHGGAGRDRTGDLLNANQALSQLSYSPRLAHQSHKIKSRPIGCRAVSTRPTTTLYTSMSSSKESGSVLPASAPVS